MKFDHIGLVVRSLPLGRETLSQIVGIEAWTGEFIDPIQLVSVQFGLDSSDICYELIAPLGDEGPVAKALSSGRNILNHVAYLVPNLSTAGGGLRDAGAVPTADPMPAVAYGGSRIQFFVTPLRFIIELIESSGHEHQYRTPKR
jgi:methylmalonyl-CoA/ethylmalonyl-CoA epimerase